MIFVTGPLFSGKRTYLQNRFGWSRDELAQQAETEVQELVAGGETPQQLEALADRLSRKAAVTASEIGCGVVPTDAAQRAGREAAGRLALLLASRADEVIRVWCGLPEKLK